MSTTGGIILRAANNNPPTEWMSKVDAQSVADCLTDAGKTDLAAKVQAVVDASS